MGKLFLKVFTTVLALVFVFGAVPLVQAQESDVDEFTLEEITVTAEKREENVQKVPIQMEVITGEELNDRGVIDLRDALRNVSTAFIQDAAKDLQIVIRGMVNNNMPGDSTNQVAVSVDGAYSNNFMTGQSGFYDMQRVEVLAGPQGTLHSRNTSGGIVNLISNDPSTEAVTGSASVGMGNYNYLTAQGVLNVPLSDTLAFRAAFNSQSHDGYLSNGTMDDDTKSARLKWGYTPNDKLSAVFTYEYTKLTGRSKSGFVVQFVDEDDVDDPWTSTIPGWLYRTDRRSERFSLNLNWTTPIGTVTILPAVAEYDEDKAQQDPLKVLADGTPAGGGPPGFGPPSTQVGWRQQIRGHQQKETSVEARMSSNEDAFLQWIVGYYFYDMNWTNPYTKPLTEIDGTVFDGVVSWSRQDNESNSVFGNVTVPVADIFRVTGGARYTSDEEFRPGGYDSTGGPSGTNFYSDPESYENEHTDYKVGMEYDVNENAMLWLDYSTGYKMGFRGRDSQTLDAYSIGEKARFLDNQLQVNTTGFYYDYANFQVDAGPHPTLDGYMGRGTGDAEMYGVDLTTEYAVTKRDRLNLSIAYLNAEISDTTIIYENMMTRDELPPETMANPPALNASPELTVTASYSHMFELADGSSLTARIDPRYVSDKSIRFQDSNDALNTEPAHIMVDASMNYYSPDGTWNINAYVKNVTNHAEKTGFYMSLDFLQIGPPRTYGAIVSVRF